MPVASAGRGLGADETTAFLPGARKVLAARAKPELGIGDDRDSEQPGLGLGGEGGSVGALQVGTAALLPGALCLGLPLLSLAGDLSLKLEAALSHEDGRNKGPS